MGAVAALWKWQCHCRIRCFTFTTDVKTPPRFRGSLLLSVQTSFWVAEAMESFGLVDFGSFRSGPGYRDAVEHSIVLEQLGAGHWRGAWLDATAFDAAAAQGRRIMVAPSAGQSGCVGFIAALGL